MISPSSHAPWADGLRSGSARLQGLVRLAALFGLAASWMGGERVSVAFAEPEAPGEAAPAAAQPAAAKSAAAKSAGAESAQAKSAAVEPEATDSGTTYFRIGNRRLTVEDIVRDLGSIEPARIAQLIEHPAMLEKQLKQLREREILIWGAENAPDIRNHPTVRRKVYQVAIQRVLLKRLDPEHLDPSKIPASEVQAYYDSHPEAYKRPALARALHLQVKTREEAMELLPKAKAAGPTAFRELVLKHTIDEETKLSSGDLGEFDQQGRYRNRADASVEKAIAEAAFKLAPGQVASQPVPVNDAWSIVKLVRLYPEKDESLEEVEASIREILARQTREEKVQEIMDDLKTRYEVTLYEDNLVPIQLELVPGTPPTHGATSPH